jgi:hypothetical protein
MLELHLKCPKNKKEVEACRKYLKKNPQFLQSGRVPPDFSHRIGNRTAVFCAFGSVGRNERQLVAVAA